MAPKWRQLIGHVAFIMRIAVTTCGTLLLMVGLALAQEDAPAPAAPASQQYQRRVRPQRFPPGTPMSEDQPIVAQQPPVAQPNPNGFQPGPRVIGPPGAQPNQNVFGNAVQPMVSQPNVSQGSVPGPGPATVPAQGASVASQMPADLAPPTPPQVTYRDGLLTVQALNSTLGSVLSAIRNKAGIQFEGLEAAPERVVVSIGPAPEGVVLAAILSGSRFDYIAIDRADSPGIVQRVVLMPRVGAAAAPAVSGRPDADTPADNDEEATADDDPDNLRGTPQDTPARPPVMQAQPIPQPLPQQPNAQPQGEPVTKTPEQLLEELKALQQRQQQSPQQTPPQKVPQ